MRTTAKNKLMLAAMLVAGVTAGPAAVAADAHAGHEQQAGAKSATGHEMPAMHDEHMALMREMKDRNDIEDLMWRYARALDSTDAEAYAAVYTEDGQFGTGDKATRGREALKNMVLGVKKSRDERIAKGEKAPGTLHMVTNHTITFQDKDHATYNAYWLTAFPGQGAENPARVGAVGRSVDELVRVNGNWLIKVRDVTPDADALASLPNHIAIGQRLHVSAQPSAEALGKLKAAGVSTVIDLRPDAETPELDEKAVVEKSGMVYRSLPIAGKTDLTKTNVAAFDKLLAEAREGSVLMHCASGNRVGAMMALRARWLQGKSAEEAMAIGKASGLTGLTSDVKALVEQNVVSSASPAWPPK